MTPDTLATAALLNVLARLWTLGACAFFLGYGLDYAHGKGWP